MKIYNENVTRNVARLTGQKTRKKDWFKRCEITKRKDIAWNK